MIKLDWTQTVSQTQEGYVITGMSVWVWENWQTPVFLTVVFERHAMLCRSKSF